LASPGGRRKKMTSDTGTTLNQMIFPKGTGVEYGFRTLHICLFTPLFLVTATWLVLPMYFNIRPVSHDEGPLFRGFRQMTNTKKMLHTVVVSIICDCTLNNLKSSLNVQIYFFLSCIKSSIRVGAFQ
jgi:hypothetical protein